MIKSTLIGLSLLACARAFAEAELKGTPADLAQYLTGVPKTVSIMGEAEIKVAADKAIVSLKVSTEHKSLREALRANQEVRHKLLDSLKQQGIPPERVQASRFSSTPKFGWFSEKAKGYRVENLVKITVLDEKEFQSAAGAVDTSPEVQYVGAEFEHEGKEALKSKAIAQACENANERSKAFQEKLGFKLLPSAFSGGLVSERLPEKPVAVDTQLTSGLRSPQAPPPMPAMRYERAEENVSSFGELIYSVQVMVEYTVHPK